MKKKEKLILTERGKEMTINTWIPEHGAPLYIFFSFLFGRMYIIFGSCWGGKWVSTWWNCMRYSESFLLVWFSGWKSWFYLDWFWCIQMVNSTCSKKDFRKFLFCVALQKFFLVRLITITGSWSKLTKCISKRYLNTFKLLVLFS